MGRYVIILLACFLAVVFGKPQPVSKNLPYTFVTRSQWGARAATGVTRLNTPVSFVVIHHSVSPGACHNTAECSLAMRSMQNVHQQSNGWADIGYNFAVGSDGAVYEGRGWQAVGAHAVNYNSQSIGIVLIGNWVSQLPPQRQLQTAQALIRQGVSSGFIRSNYRLIGHRQVAATECPGQRLFNEIRTWNGFTQLRNDDADLDEVLKQLKQ